MPEDKRSARIVIRSGGIIGGYVHGEPDGCAGQFLQGYDPEAFGGRGNAVFTDNFDDAIKFSTMEEAVEFARQTPHSRPIRDDGKPNLPLLAFFLEYVRVEVNPHE